LACLGISRAPSPRFRPLFSRRLNRRCALRSASSTESFVVAPPMNVRMISLAVHPCVSLRLLSSQRGPSLRPNDSIPASIRAKREREGGRRSRFPTDVFVRARSRQTREREGGHPGRTPRSRRAPAARACVGA
jgi:hypothetical protein